MLNICADGTTTRYGMHLDLAYWELETRYWQAMFVFESVKVWFDWKGYST